MVPKLQQLKDSQNNRKQKEMHCFFWLYLTIYAADFLLILLDRNTYQKVPVDLSNGEQSSNISKYGPKVDFEISNIFKPSILALQVAL